MSRPSAYSFNEWRSYFRSHVEPGVALDSIGRKRAAKLIVAPLMARHWASLANDARLASDAGRSPSHWTHCLHEFCNAVLLPGIEPTPVLTDIEPLRKALKQLRTATVAANGLALIVVADVARATIAQGDVRAPNHLRDPLAIMREPLVLRDLIEALEQFDWASIRWATLRTKHKGARARANAVATYIRDEVMPRYFHRKHHAAVAEALKAAGHGEFSADDVRKAGRAGRTEGKKV